MKDAQLRKLFRQSTAHIKPALSYDTNWIESTGETYFIFAPTATAYAIWVRGYAEGYNQRGEELEGRDV